MNGLVLDLQGLMVVLQYEVSSLAVGVELLQTEADQKAFSLDVSISGLNISECLAGKAMGCPFYNKVAPMP